MKKLLKTSPSAFLVFSCLLLSMPVSSDAAQPSSSNTTIASSLVASTNGTSYLLSPSGTFAFGFRSLPTPDQYRVALWVANSSDKSVVWVPSRNGDIAVDKGSSISLNQDGVLMLKKAGLKEEPLLSNNLNERIFYVTLHDTGNLAIYNNNSDIIWQSFDFPTDTILPGQTLRTGDYLVTPDYQVTVEESGNLAVYYRCYIYDNRWSNKGELRWCYRWASETGGKGSHVVLNLDNTGRLYLADSNLLVIKNFTKGVRQNHGGNTLYRAKLDVDGYFRLYSETLGSGDGKSGVLWQSGCPECKEHRAMVISVIIMFSIFVGVILYTPLAVCFSRLRENMAHRRLMQPLS